MSRTGATCPCCGAIMTMQDVRLEGRAGRLDAVMTTVVVDGLKGQGVPPAHWTMSARLRRCQRSVCKSCTLTFPFGLPEEQTPKAGSGASRAFSVDGYGLDTWRKLFTNRQLVGFGDICFLVCSDMNKSREHTIRLVRQKWSESIPRNVLGVDVQIASQTADSTICRPGTNRGERGSEGTFSRFALPIVWDYCRMCKPYLGPQRAAMSQSH